MNFEQTFRSEKETIHPRMLLKACQKFADILANGGWFESENHEVSITRSFTEVIGRDTTLKIEGALTPIIQSRIKTEVGFQAEKEPIEYDENSVLLEEMYTLSAKVTEVVHHSEVPERVLSQVSEFINSDDDNDDSDDENDGDVIGNQAAISEDIVLSRYTFERQHEVAYVVDEDGEVSDYLIAVRYLVDGDEFDEETYSWGGAMLDTLPEPSFVHDDKVVEWKKSTETDIDESEIEHFLGAFDSIMQKIMDTNKFDDLTSELAPEDDEHHRRALGILAMTSYGFRGIRL